MQLICRPHRRSPLWITAIVAVRLWRVWIARLVCWLARIGVELCVGKPYLRRAVHPLTWLMVASCRWAFPADMPLPRASEMLAHAKARAKERGR